MPGQFHSVASHAARWKLFCDWAKTQGINEARQVTVMTLCCYADYLRCRLQGQGKSLAVSTAHNRLSTCNCVLRALRDNDDITIKPAEALGVRRVRVRTIPPEMNRSLLQKVQSILRQQGDPRTAVILGLCRELGLRLREAVLLNCRLALAQAEESGCIDIVRGTKGGRGKSTCTSPSRVKRLVPVTEAASETLRTAVQLQDSAENLVPTGRRLTDFLSSVRHKSGPPLRTAGIKNRHELRAAYACERYQTLTGVEAPVKAGKRLCCKETDHWARAIIVKELGHNRTDVVSAYVGSAR